MVKEVSDIQSHLIKCLSAKVLLGDDAGKNQVLFFHVLSQLYEVIGIFLVQVVLQACDFSLECKFDYARHCDTIFDICHRGYI